MKKIARAAMLGTGLAGLALTISMPVQADSISECYALHDDHPQVSACLTERVKGTEGALKESFEDAHEAAEKMEKITGGSMKTVAPLEASQKAFEAYRKSSCDDAIPPMWGGGSGTGDAVAECHIRMNRERIAWLDSNYPDSN